MRLSNDLKRRKDLTSNTKLVYTHMLDKYVFFSSQGKAYYENMQDIADELGLARKTVNDSIKTLEEEQMLTIFKKSVHKSDKSIVSHSYVVKDLYNLYKPAKVLHLNIEEDSPF